MHREVPDAAQLLAIQVEGSCGGRSEPVARDQAGHQIHLDPELRHGEIVQHIERAQHHLARNPDRQVQLGTRDQDVVLSLRIVRIDAEWIRIADEARIGGSQHAVLARETEHPVPLAAQCLDRLGVLRDIDDLGPREQARGQQSGDPDPRQNRQPGLEFLVLRLVGRLRSVAMSKARHTIRQEQTDNDEDEARDDDCRGGDVVDHAPVGRERRVVPRAQEMKQHRAEQEDDQHDS